MPPDISQEAEAEKVCVKQLGIRNRLQQRAANLPLRTHLAFSGFAPTLFLDLKEQE
jgi:hypothetical protein